MAVQCLHPRIDAGAAAGSPTFPFFDDGAGVDTVRALQHLQSRLARLDRERHEAEACSEVLREDIAARELDLARLAAEADAADATDEKLDPVATGNDVKGAETKEESKEAVEVGEVQLVPARLAEA